HAAPIATKLAPRETEIRTPPLKMSVRQSQPLTRPQRDQIPTVFWRRVVLDRAEAIHRNRATLARQLQHSQLKPGQKRSAQDPKRHEDPHTSGQAVSHSQSPPSDGLVPLRASRNRAGI